MPRSKEDYQKIKEESRVKILNSALNVFVADGIKATIGDIAKDANISKGLIYHYFESKEALILDLLEMGRKGSMDMISEIAGSQMSAEEGILAISEMMTGAIYSDNITSKFFVLYIQLSVSGPSLKIQQKMKEMREPSDIFAKLVERAQKEGSGKKGDPYELSYYYWAVVTGLCCYMLSGVSMKTNANVLAGTVLNMEGEGEDE